MFYLVSIYSEKDFERLREFNIIAHHSNRIVIKFKKDIVFKNSIEPINLEGFDVTILGMNHTIENINIVEEKDFIALFEKVNSIFVENLKVKNCYVYGNVKCATLAAEVSEHAAFDNVDFENVNVESEAFAGGLIARAKEVYINNSYVSSNVCGHDVVGGVVGMTDKYTETNCQINSNCISVGKAIGNSVGYADVKLIKKI